MRWNGLFADLEAQLGREMELETDAMAADELRVERGRRLLVDRLADLASSGPVALRLIDGSVSRINVDAVGDGWLAGRQQPSGTCRIQCLSAVVSATADPSPSVPRSSRLERTALPFRIVLRDLSRRRTAVTLITPAGAEHGTIDAVGADHIELAVHPVGSVRRAEEVRGHQLLPLHAVLALTY